MKRVFSILEIVCCIVGILFCLVYVAESLHANAWLLMGIMLVGLIAMAGVVCQIIRERKERS